MVPDTAPSQVPHEPHPSRRIGALLENAVFGFMDGLVTDLAVVAGVVAAPNSSIYFVVVAGIAATLASSVSMFLGAYIAAETRYRYTMREMAREIREVEEMPEMERQEIRDIYLQQGFSAEETEPIVQKITADKSLWVKTMMREELGFGEDEMEPPSLLREAAVGLTTLLGSSLPLLPFVVTLLLPNLASGLGIPTDDVAFLGSLALSSVALAAVGVLKERYGENRPLKGALQTLALGLGGAAVVYLIVNGIGYLLR